MSNDQGGIVVKQYYLVVVDTKLPNGGTLLQDRRSRQINRVGTLLRVLKRVRRHMPKAYAIEAREFR